MRNNQIVDKEKFAEYMKVFLEQNSKINLISKNDEKFLWEKHICDSLAISKFFEKYCVDKNLNLLDIGTGGGFPSVPVAIQYPEVKVTGLDSIKKKIVAIINIANILELKNFNTICDRAENLQIEYKNHFNVITSRAVAPLKVILGYGLPLLEKGGYFVAYKSIKTDEEISEAKLILKKFNANVVEIIPYELPLEDILTRNLIIIRKN